MDEVRFDHCLPYLGNGSYDIVLNVQLPPADIERITVTVSTGEYQESLPPTNTSRQEHPDFIRYMGQSDGQARSISDWSNYGYFLSQLEVIEIASDLGNKKQISTMANEKTPIQNMDDYLKGFVEGYRRHMERMGYEDFPNHDDNKPKKRALLDKEMDINGEGKLPENLVIFQATLQAREDMSPELGTQNKVIYRQEIAKYAYIYTQAYKSSNHELTRKKEEYIDRYDRSDFR